MKILLVNQFLKTRHYKNPIYLNQLICQHELGEVNYVTPEDYKSFLVSQIEDNNEELVIV